MLAPFTLRMAISFLRRLHASVTMEYIPKMAIRMATLVIIINNVSKYLSDFVYSEYSSSMFIKLAELPTSSVINLLIASSVSNLNSLSYL